MDSDQQEMCQIASMNAHTLEELMLTVDDVMSLSQESVEDIIDRCKQIIHCMQECFDE